jgi:hypothetical protein
MVRMKSWWMLGYVEQRGLADHDAGGPGGSFRRDLWNAAPSQRPTLSV